MLLHSFVTFTTPLFEASKIDYIYQQLITFRVLSSQNYKTFTLQKKSIKKFHWILLKTAMFCS